MSADRPTAGPRQPRRTTLLVLAALVAVLALALAYAIGRASSRPAAVATTPVAAPSVAAPSVAATSAAPPVDPSGSDACHQMATALQFGTTEDPTVMAQVGRVAASSTDDDWRIVGHLLEDRANLAKAELATGDPVKGRAWLAQAVDDFQVECTRAGLLN